MYKRMLLEHCWNIRKTWTLSKGYGSSTEAEEMESSGVFDGGGGAISLG